MTEQPLLGPWIRRFLLEHLVSERNLARNTQRSYRDTFCLLIPFAAEKLQQKVDRIRIIEISADLVRSFLTYLKDVRHKHAQPAPRGYSCAGRLCGQS